MARSGPPERREEICALCERPIPPHARQSRHHLTPKLRGGSQGPTVRLHQICHNEIHAALTETELARDYADPERLRAHPRLARFIAWIANKPPDFHGRSLTSLRRRRKR
ncbi:MAG: HNH endonuclease [Pseudomonadota bacterium]